MDEYIAALNNGAYDEMYELLDEESQKETDQETFTERNKNIYEGIEASNLTVEITDEGSENRTSGQTTQNLTYQMKMDTMAGELSFTQTATFHKSGREGYRLSWNDSLIFPHLLATDKIRVERWTQKEAASMTGTVSCWQGKALSHRSVWFRER